MEDELLILTSPPTYPEEKRYRSSTSPRHLLDRLRAGHSYGKSYSLPECTSHNEGYSLKESYENQQRGETEPAGEHQ